jgi:hypothetical protein
MLKRTISAVVWFMAAWESGSAIDLLAGPDLSLLAPVLAFGAAALVALDPVGWFRVRSARASAVTRLATSTQGQTS